MSNSENRSGRRERVRGRYLKEGLDGFEEYQVLELLLYYSIPQKDTADIARRLIKTFGSLAGVLEARPEELAKVEGIGENSAVLISMIPGIFRKYNESGNTKKTEINSIDKAGKYFINFFIGRPYEVFYAMCLDSNCKVINVVKISEGTIDEAPAYPRLVVEAALNNKAHSVIIAHNHPGGVEYPSQADINITKKIDGALSAVDIKLRDHIVVANKKYFSFKNLKMLG